MAKQNSNETILTTIGAVFIIVIVIVVVLLIRSKHSNTTIQSLTPTQTNVAKQQIEKNWKTFFAASTPLQNREKLLQNGNKFSQPLQEEFTALSSQASSAVVNSINVENSTSASVAYTVELMDNRSLKDQTGKALFLNNAWVVSDSTLCGLLSMGGSHPSACQNY